MTHQLWPDFQPQRGARIEFAALGPLRPGRCGGAAKILGLALAGLRDCGGGTNAEVVSRRRLCCQDDYVDRERRS